MSVIWKNRSEVFIPFFGTHDECQHRLENDSRLKKVVAGSGNLIRIPRGKKSSPNQARDYFAALEADNEDEIPVNASDDDLRCVFSGLVEGARKQ